MAYRRLAAPRHDDTIPVEGWRRRETGHRRREQILEGRPGEHIMSVPPYAVFYSVDSSAITVLTIKDGRQRRDPW